VSDEPKRGNDLSELADELPPTKQTVTVGTVPIGLVDEGDPTGESAKRATHEDGSKASIRSKVFVPQTGEEQLRRLQCRQRPCAACAFAKWPSPGTAAYAAREAAVQDVHRRRIFLDMNAEQFVYCEDDPTDGPGFKWMGHNCVSWKRSVNDLLPDHVPGFMRETIKKAQVVSDYLRKYGVRGVLNLLNRSRRPVC
jgi:hypothetical protein